MSFVKLLSFGLSFQLVALLVALDRGDALAACSNLALCILWTYFLLKE